MRRADGQPQPRRSNGKVTLSPREEIEMADVETTEYAAFARRVITGLAKRIGEGDLESLPDLLALRDLIDEKAADAVTALRAEPHLYSWRNIAETIGVTRQAAMQRWPNPDKTTARQPGGQPIGVR